MTPLVIFWNRLGEIKVREPKEGLVFENDPKWEHIASVDAAAFLESILNKYPKIVAKEIRSKP